jgi:DNA helicase-4
MRNNPDAHVFRVGDDWQAIYSFAGSETKYINDSSPGITKYDLVQNHRSAPEIVKAGNQVMRDTVGKPGQSSGQITEGTVQFAAVEDYKFSPIELGKYQINNFRRFDIEPMVLRLVCKFLEQGKRVVLLSRTHNPPHVEGRKDLEGFLRGVKSQLPKEVRDKKNRVTASTIHNYKGREEDVVIMMDCFGSRYPFFHEYAKFDRIWGVTPDSISRDELNVAYVAVTRAKSDLVLITSNDDCPDFLNRIMELPFVKKVDWKWFPVLEQEHEQWLVRIGNHYPDIFSTMYIKQALLASIYDWRPEDSVWKNSWIKIIRVNGRTIDDLIDQMQREAWCTKAANNVEVRIYNQNEEVLKRFKVVEGVWQELGDMPPQASTNNPGSSWPKPDNSQSTSEDIIEELPWDH